MIQNWKSTQQDFDNARQTCISNLKNFSTVRQTYNSNVKSSGTVLLFLNRFKNSYSFGEKFVTLWPQNSRHCETNLQFASQTFFTLWDKVLIQLSSFLTLWDKLVFQISTCYGAVTQNCNWPHRDFDMVIQHSRSLLKVFGSVVPNCDSNHKHYHTVRQILILFRHKTFDTVGQICVSLLKLFAAVIQKCKSNHKFDPTMRQNCDSFSPLNL